MIDDPPQVAVTEYVPAAEQDVTYQCSITLPFFPDGFVRMPVPRSYGLLFQSEYPKRFLGPIDFAAERPLGPLALGSLFGFP